MQKRSGKNKGNRLENYLLKKFRAELDANATKSPASGAGIDKGDVRLGSYNLLIEAKNAKQINLLNWWQQAKDETYGEDSPVLAMRNPKKPEFEETIIAMELETFIELLQNQGGETEVIDTLESRDKYKVKQSIENLKEVLKIFEKYE